MNDLIATVLALPVLAPICPISAVVAIAAIVAPFFPAPGRSLPTPSLTGW